MNLIINIFDRIGAFILDSIESSPNQKNIYPVRNNWQEYRKPSSLNKSSSYNNSPKGKYPTLNGDMVRSIGERDIANFLSEQKIRYEYERPLKFSSGHIIHPDFYLIDYDVYIEYFGMLGDPKYNRSIAWKKNNFKKDGLKLLELYPDNQADLANIIKYRFEKITHKTFPQRKFFSYKKQLSCNYSHV